MELYHTLFTNTWQTGLVFLFLLIFARILGKTQVGQLTFYEYISGITIGSIAGNIAAAEGEDFYWHMYDLALFVLLTFLIAYLSLKSRRLRRLVEGTPAVLISHGVIHKANMRAAHFDLDQLVAELRLRGVSDIRDVAFAFLETSGQLSIIKNAAAEPPNRADLNVSYDNVQLPLEVVLDGEVLTENLAKRGLSKEWLDKKLAEKNIENKGRIFYAALDRENELILFLDNE